MMQSIVKDRVESDAYLNKLGIVHHQAKEDLDRLDAAMHNKYLQEIKAVIPEKKLITNVKKLKGALIESKVRLNSCRCCILQVMPMVLQTKKLMLQKKKLWVQREILKL